MISSVRQVPLLEPLKQYFADKDQVGYVITSADGLLCTETAWDRGWESYITALETALNGIHKHWYHLNREWKSSYPEEYEQYMKLKRKTNCSKLKNTDYAGGRTLRFVRTTCGTVSASGALRTALI